jgi:death on curing protein
MEILYLTADQVKWMHDELIREFGGLEGVRSEHLLASAVFQPRQSAFGEDAYDTIADKAAAYGFCIAEDQPFIDGNKRTAATAMLTFLAINGYNLFQTDDEIAVMFEDVGKHIIDQGEFFGWVANHARPAKVVQMPAVNNKL